ncbi:hypothetical protein XENOCAPTIV_015430 [Xenoophorus captivus]|uniref:Uncharacterized protein n=1 Tax=Xenoophorus captivus TaxID=1517983 RepID=A0ABV0QT13_9TELE
MWEWCDSLTDGNQVVTLEVCGCIPSRSGTKVRSPVNTACSFNYLYNLSTHLVSRRRSLSSSMDTINDSKWPSESDCSGEPEPRRPVPFPPPGPSVSLMVGITSHIIFNHVVAGQQAEQQGFKHKQRKN